MDSNITSAVDWTQTGRDGAGHERVAVTCPVCHMARMALAAMVRGRIKDGTFTARCGADRGIGAARRHRRQEWPEHSAVDWTRCAYRETNWQSRDRNYPKREMVAPARCPKCAQERLVQAGVTAHKIRHGRFTGLCIGCSKNAHKREWRVLSPGRKVDPVKGYVRLGAEGVNDADRHLFDAMRGKATYGLEHRLVMARELGRPLLTTELVDHMDGDKTNNDPANLRLYVRGRQMPGDHSGNGTFYHEWQLAEARVRLLEFELGRLRGKHV